MEKLLSIIVPTKNRYIYLKGLIEIFINCRSKKTELIIQDNSADNTEFICYLNRIACKDIRYYYKPEPLSVVENMDYAVSHAVGKYICILGDDDLYSSYLERFVKYMNKAGIESVMFSNDSVYFWPGIDFIAHPLPSLMIEQCRNRLRKISPAKARAKCMRTGAINLDFLPRVYHGVVSRNVMQKVYKETGSFFPGASPDMASAIALSYFVRNHYYCDLPLIISGKSPNSVGGKKGRHPSGEIKNIKHLPVDTEENWPVSLPKFWSAGTIWAQSLFESMTRLGHKNELNRFNYAACYANVAVFESIYRGRLSPFLKGHFLLKLKFLIECFKLFTFRCKVFIKNMALSRLHFTNMHVYNNVKDSMEASKIVDAYVQTIIKSRKQK